MEKRITQTALFAVALNYCGRSVKKNLCKQKILKLVPTLLTLQKKWNFPLRISSVNVTKSAVFCGGRVGIKRPPLPKICDTYLAIMKLGTVIPYLRRIQKIYESRDTPPEFCWNQCFFTGNQQILLYQEIQM